MIADPSDPQNYDAWSDRDGWFIVDGKGEPVPPYDRRFASWHDAKFAINDLIREDVDERRSREDRD